MTPRLPVVNSLDYTYDLPESKIARYPLSHRDQSKLLVYKEGQITHQIFNQLADNLPVNSVLFFNDTKVIPARILFKKDSGANIEVFLLSPVSPHSLISEALAATKRVTWKCAIRNMKRWEEGSTLRKQMSQIDMVANWQDRNRGLVEFSWTPEDLPFASIIQEAGAVPLPPYIKRDPEISDRERYQTVYSHFEGAVAAPTAGLHFTPEILKRLHDEGIQSEFLTLHVSAGTFLPIKEENATDHVMHEEQIIIHKHNIIRLLRTNVQTIAVGTTALRTLESMYWYGALLIHNQNTPFCIHQHTPYDFSGEPPTVQEALKKILQVMERLGVEELTGHTSLYILPGYRFRTVRGLITNFHQPNSTLLLLIAAFIGPSWKQVYEAALTGNYRFLSYGDSSLLLPDNNLIT